MKLDYEFYHVDPIEIDYTPAVIMLARDDYDCTNECGHYAPTPKELAERMSDDLAYYHDERKLIAACRRWISQSEKIHNARKAKLGLL